MFFESRIDPPSVSEAYQECARLFHAGKVRQARQHATQLRSAGGPRTPEDFLLCSDISRAGGFHREYFGTIKMARKKHPNDRRVYFESLRVRSVRGYLLDSLRKCQELLDNSANGDRPLILGLMASGFAQVGLRDRAKETFTRISDLGEITDAKIWYELAYGSLCLRLWDEAIERSRRAVAMAPSWPRARLFLAQALLARGREMECRSVVQDGLAAGIDDANLELMAAFYALNLGKHETALTLFSNYQYTWGRPRTEMNLRKLLPVLPWDLPPTSKAVERLRQLDPEASAEITRSIEKGRRRVISLPTMCQESTQCVPTCVAMVSQAQGLGQDPNVLYEAMTGRHGTPMWRMCEEMLRQKFRLHFINTRPESIRGMLDQGVPLIGQLDGVFSNHVEVICGYDVDPDVFYVRDPENWSPIVIAGEELAFRYLLSGDGVVALIAPNRVDQITVNPSWAAPECRALVELERACARGDREAAERAHAAVPDSHEAAQTRDTLGRGVTLTPTQFGESMDRASKDPERHPIARLRAILALDSPDRLDEVLQSIDEPEREFGPGVVRLIEMMRLSFVGEWARVLEHTDWLLERTPQIETIWVHRAEALAEMGRIDEAKECAQTATDLAPDSPFVRHRVRTLIPDEQAFKEELAEAQALVERYPDNHWLEHGVASLLRSNGDGLAFEKQELRCQHFFPRLPECYGRLADWYLAQGRQDLARTCLERGRSLVGSDELPLWDFESGDEPAVEIETEEVLEETSSGADKFALFASARRELAGFFSREAKTTPSLDMLRDLNQRGRLNWFESAQFLALEMDRVAFSTTGEDEAEAQIRALLPKTLPGPAQSFLNIIFDRALLNAYPRKVCVLLREWGIHHTRGSELNGDTRFNLAYLDELCGDINTAESSYRDIAETSPGMSAISWYRLGECCTQRGEFEAAVEAHRRAVAVMPGHEGSLRSLLGLLNHLERPEEAIDIQKAICALLPYNTNELEDLALMTAHVHDKAVAFSEINRLAPQHLKVALKLVMARVHAELGSFGEAESAIRSLDPEAHLEDSDRYRMLTIELQCALGEERWNDAAPLIDAGLEMQPDDLWLLSLKGRLFEQQDEAQAFHFYRDVLEKGIHEPHFATAFLARIGSDPEGQAIRLVEQTDQLARGNLSRALTDGFFNLGMIQSQVVFLEWCAANVPEATDLRAVYARRLVMANRYSEAVEVARTLYEADPESPHWIGLLAYCLQDNDPTKALEYYRKQYEMTGNVQTLADIGRSQLLLREIDEAKMTYLQVLEIDPINTLALIGLVEAGHPPGELYDNFSAAVERGLGEDVQMFHVYAIKAARERGAQLPLTWGQTAYRRMGLILQEGGFGNEQAMLASALAKWLDIWNEPALARQTRSAASWWSRISLWPWPGTDWIPKPGDV